MHHYMKSFLDIKAVISSSIKIKKKFDINLRSWLSEHLPRTFFVVPFDPPCKKYSINQLLQHVSSTTFSWDVWPHFLFFATRALLAQLFLLWFRARTSRSLLVRVHFLLVLSFSACISHSCLVRRAFLLFFLFCAHLSFLFGPLRAILILSCKGPPCISRSWLMLVVYHALRNCLYVYILPGVKLIFFSWPIKVPSYV